MILKILLKYLFAHIYYDDVIMLPGDEGRKVSQERYEAKCLVTSHLHDLKLMPYLNFSIFIHFRSVIHLKIYTDK